ncbi:TraR/DksA family transcriptional regulator [Nocardioides sp. Soil805]|uniref:TraR/DksA family transcriptional regulator n=1 Tax=Nocardioides sp. Soil805 TaxID=1736416 RepID=UPI0009E74B01|nr:TraR/DksA family transcriptional regulator [Nocardioides sp. Soil805]
MASTRKSLAGSAAAAAKKVIGRRSATAAADADTPASAKKSTAKKTPAKKSPAKKSPAATKAPAATAPAKKAPAKKAPAKKAPATKASATKAPATKAPAKKAPAAKTASATSASKKTASKKTVTKKAAVKKTDTKVSAKKAPMSSLVVKEGEGSWTKAELDEVVADLNTQRDKLVHVLDEAEHELAGLMRDAGDGAGHDQADMGATSFERDHELTVLNNEREMLAQIDRALGRIHDGSYGICESCGEPIGKMRLMAFPRATLCMTCKQREERR